MERMYERMRRRGKVSSRFRPGSRRRGDSLVSGSPRPIASDRLRAEELVGSPAPDRRMTAVLKTVDLPAKRMTMRIRQVVNGYLRYNERGSFNLLGVAPMHRITAASGICARSATSQGDATVIFRSDAAEARLS